MLSESDHGHNIDAIIAGKSQLLPKGDRELLASYAAKVRVLHSLKLVNLENAMVEVSTSGWGKEGDSTQPGAVITSADRS